MVKFVGVIYFVGAIHELPLRRYLKNTAIIFILFLFCGCVNHYKTPETAVKYFWACMAENDAEKVLKTQAYYQKGMTSEYIHPPENIQWLYLDSMETEYITAKRAKVYYQVVFKKKDQVKTTRYSTGTMAIKKDKEWKVGMMIGRRAKSESSP